MDVNATGFMVCMVYFVAYIIVGFTNAAWHYMTPPNLYLSLTPAGGFIFLLFLWMGACHLEEWLEKQEHQRLLEELKAYRG